MIARFASVCTCGCRRPYVAGAELVRARTGWVLESCVDPREPALPASTSLYATPEEARAVIRRAQVVRDTAEAADRIRAAHTALRG